MTQHEDLRRKMAEVIQQYLQLDTALRKVESTHFRVCIFGSARIQPNDALYHTVNEVARKLAQLGIDIVTGGGPGLMEAANRAVREAQVKRVRSYGLPLDIPGFKEPPNPHLDIKSMHQRFSSRLDEFMRLSEAVVVAPGGIGTALELFYVWQLLQLSMVEPRPLILLGKEYWKGLLDWMENTVLQHHLISPQDMGFITVVETPDEVVEIIGPVFEAYKERRRAERESAKELSGQTPGLPKTKPEGPLTVASSESMPAGVIPAALPATTPSRLSLMKPVEPTPTTLRATQGHRRRRAFRRR